MSDTKRVLFLQHAGVLGGSVKSLRMLVQSLSGTGYEPRVCLLRPNRETVEYYQDYGVPVFVTRNILPLFHCQGAWANFADPFSSAAWMRGLLHWRRSAVETARIVRENPCDVVHVNSSILAPSAFALRRMGQRFVWHVREAPQPLYFGNRLRLYRRWLRDWPAERAFISASDRLGWMGDDCGEVIPHAVDEDLFRVREDSSRAKRELGLEQGAKCVLFVGGFSRIKGIFVLLEALEILLAERMKLVCLMPGTVRERGTGWRSRLGRAAFRLAVGGTDEEKALIAIREKRLDPSIRRMGFAKDLGPLLEASDVLVFPSTVPHYAMPVMEAAAAARPVVASDFPVMRELVDDGKTGVLVRHDDARGLAAALRLFLDSPERCLAVGRAARERARLRNAQSSEGARFVEIYDRVTRGGVPGG